MEFKVSAPGKIILYGEHAVVYGKTAAAASLDLRTTLEFKELDDEVITLSMPKVRLQINISVNEIVNYFLSNDCPEFLDHENFYPHVQKFVERIGYTNLQQKLALEAFFYLLIGIAQVEGLRVRPFRVTMDSALAISSGLGSSASFAVCIATCFLHLSRVQKNEVSCLDGKQLESISRFAFSCEKIMHGTPSGIDNSVCTYGSIIEFRRGEVLEPILGAKQMRVLLVDTRVQRSTKALVDKLGELKRRYPSIFGPVLEAIDQVSKEALLVIKRLRNLSGEDEGIHTNYQQLMTLMEVNQGLLATCQVSHPSLDRICAEAKNYGLAAKLTGAGGGGYAYILLLPDTPTETITSISKKLIANGYLITLTNLGGAGVQLHTS
ncbi:mevalonate kinase [Fopius arisanus]|uniref:Mevalonate kinase n=1 Tax=Fopius arisanus TaxID=64838 RepID=A0A9R1SXC0_9HYME|nr:PREDICTED: mevalonate kinase [Fopius arisanus]XP_011298861.1 PREDICTED: mevalonate kinase [Fopius arisanus]